LLVYFTIVSGNFYSLSTSVIFNSSLYITPFAIWGGAYIPK